MKKKCKAKVVARALGSLLVGTILLTTIMAHTPALAQLSNYNPQGLEATTLEEVLALPDKEIDLATAIMILYKEWDASFDVAGSLEEIDRMALELELRISPEDNPERVVSLINQYLFEENTYSGADPSDPGFMKDLEISALPCVMENKKGNCLGLSLLYLALAERLGLPFYGVAAPEHVFVRYDDGKKAINVETTQEGKEYKDSHYEKVFMLHPTYRDYNIYLRNLLKRELIGSFLNDLGLSYYEKGMYDEAIPQYKSALAISPNFVEAHYNLGLVYGRKEMHGEAICECKKAIEINPNDAKAHYNLGVVYHGSGMYDKAIGELKKALAIKPYYAEAHTNLGAAYGGKGMYDKAIAELKKALAINPRDVEAHYNLGLCYRRKGMYDEAIAELKEALEINPGHAEVLYGLGVVYGHKGMVDKAIAEYKKALEVNPNYADAHYNLGVAYAAKGMLDKAIAEYRKVLDINPDCAEAHNNLAVVYYFNGQYSLAIEHCDKVIELGYRVHPEFLEDLEPYREK